MTTKYQIVKCANDLQCSILNTFVEYSHAIAFLNKHIVDEYELGSSFKCYHEDEHVLTIFKYNYIFPKEVVAKYHVITFEDETHPKCQHPYNSDSE